MKSNLDTIIHPSTMAGQKGLLCCANVESFSANFDAGNYLEGLEDYIPVILGTDLAYLEEELNILAPAVRAPKKFEFKKGPSAITFLGDGDDARAIGAEFNRIKDHRESDIAKTTNRGLTYTIDREEMMDGDVELTIKWLTAICLRNSILRAKTLLRAAANTVNKTWNSVANPDGDLRTRIRASLPARGIKANTLVFGDEGWAQRQVSYETSAKNGALALAGYTPEQLARKLGIRKCHVSESVYRAGKGKSLVEVFGSTAIAYHIDEVPNKEDASNIKRFWTPCEDGQMFRVYIKENMKTIEVTVEYYSKEIVVDTTGIEEIAISAA